MNQLFYNIAGGIVHQIRREKQTTIQKWLFSEANRDGTDAESSFPLFFSFLPHLRTLAQESRNILAKYNIFPLVNNCRSRKKFWWIDLLTASACTIGILSTLTYTEFDCVALLAKL